MQKIAVVAMMVALGACSGSRAPTTAPGAAPDFNRGTVLIDTDGESVLFYAFVAESAEQPRFAVMHEGTLPDNKGVVFLYFEPASRAFQLKETAVPLSIALFDVDGRITETSDVEPCGATGGPCSQHDPGTEYMGALVVNDGAFERLGVAAGDVVEIVPGS